MTACVTHIDEAGTRAGVQDDLLPGLVAALERCDVSRTKSDERARGQRDVHAPDVCERSFASHSRLETASEESLPARKPTLCRTRPRAHAGQTMMSFSWPWKAIDGIEIHSARDVRGPEAILKTRGAARRSVARYIETTPTRGVECSRWKTPRGGRLYKRDSNLDLGLVHDGVRGALCLLSRVERCKKRYVGNFRGVPRLLRLLPPC